MIHVKDDWYIDIDEYTYNLMQFAGTYTDKKTGAEMKQWKNVSYHSTLDKALIHFKQNDVRDALRDAEAIEINEAIEIIRRCNIELKQRIEELLNGEIVTSNGREKKNDRK